MKTLLRILKWTGIVLAIVIIGLVIAVYTMYPPKMDAPFPDIAASTDSAVIAHGKYLVYGPAHCAECHSGTREDLMNGIPLSQLTLSGGMAFNMPGAAVHSKNITPDKETGTGRYSDKELARMIRHGVRPDGTVMFPFMAYANLNDEDLTAIISYLRTVAPVKKEVPEDHLNFMMKGVMAFMIRPYPAKEGFPRAVKRDTTVEYGEYLARAVSGCEDCHTKFDEMSGKFTGTPFAGGGKTPSATEEPGVWVMTANLTPDPETGTIATWSYERFKERFQKEGRRVKESIMAWETFVNYSDDDLKAVYKYLMSLPPVKNDIGDILIREEQ